MLLLWRHDLASKVRNGVGHLRRRLSQSLRRLLRLRCRLWADRRRLARCLLAPLRGLLAALTRRVGGPLRIFVEVLRRSR